MGIKVAARSGAARNAQSIARLALAVLRRGATKMVFWGAIVFLIVWS